MQLPVSAPTSTSAVDSVGHDHAAQAPASTPTRPQHDHCLLCTIQFTDPGPSREGLVAWGGSLLALGLLWNGRPEMLAAVERLSRLGGLAVLVFVLSGSLLALTHLSGSQENYAINVPGPPPTSPPRPTGPP